MIKKLLLYALCLIAVVPISGCWSYRGLNEMSIVSGIAIDKDAATGDYCIAYEIIDLTKPVKESGLTGKIIDSQGQTLFDATRNAKNRLVNRLYFGSTQTIVLSEDIARSQDMLSIIDWFLRDAECRETVCIVISQEKSAREILATPGIDQSVTGLDLYDIVVEDKNDVSTTVYMPLYQIYDVQNGEGLCLTLPAVHSTLNNEETVNEANGIAVFDRNHMLGYLDVQQSKYFMFATDKVSGGILTLSNDDSQQEDISMEIGQNKTETSYTYENGELKIQIHADTLVYVGEDGRSLDSTDPAQIAALEAKASQMLQSNMQDVIAFVQSQYNADIFGFGNMIYKRDPKLWEQLKPDWDTIFPRLQVEVEAEVHITNTASIQKSLS